MTRRSRPGIEAGGHGALLPIVANLVGVLIVVVFVIAERVKVPAAGPDDDGKPKLAELDSRRGMAGSLEDEIHTLDAQAQRVQALAGARYAERAALAAEVAADEKTLADRRAALAADGKQQFDLTRETAQAQAELARLDALRSEAKNKPGKTIQIQNYPTPISHVVNGKEMHFQLKDGRIVQIPLEDLLERFKAVAKEKLWRLEGQDEMSDTVGPVSGFALRYFLAKEEMPGHGQVIRLSRWELQPVKDNLGETAEEALGGVSAFRVNVGDLRPADWTITLWVYPDSFETFRAVRKELYQMGFAIAGRPLPMDYPIGALPNGSKSAAE